MSTKKQQTIGNKINLFVSNLILKLYQKKWFQWMRLDTDSFLKAHIKSNKQDSLARSLNDSLRQIDLEVDEISFIDYIRLDDLNDFENTLVKTYQKYEASIFSPKLKDIRKTFERINENIYSESVHVGDIMSITTQNSSGLDLVEGLTVSFKKIVDSHLLVGYRIKTSEKFKNLFSKYYHSEATVNTNINFNSFIEIVKTQQIASGVTLSFNTQSNLINSLIKSIYIQFKTKLLRNKKLGVFQSDNNYSLPRIITFEYEGKNFVQYKDSVIRRITGHDNNDYYDSENVISIPYGMNSNEAMMLFVPKETSRTRDTDSWFIKNFIFDNCAPYWGLTSMSRQQNYNLSKIRMKLNRQLKTKKQTLFAKDDIFFKHWVTLQKTEFEDIIKTGENFSYIENLEYFTSIANVRKQSFKESLVQYAEDESERTKQKYEEMSTIYSKIMDSSLLLSNSRLQKTLLTLAVIGILLTIYSVNSAWFNAWFTFILNKLNIDIPYPNK